MMEMVEVEVMDEKNRRFVEVMDLIPLFVEVMEKISLVYVFLWGKSGCLLFLFAKTNSSS